MRFDVVMVHAGIVLMHPALASKKARLLALVAF